jgi:hypothetical protein
MATRKGDGGTGDLPAGLAAPAVRALNGAGITRLEQLARRTEAEVLALHGMGPKAMALLKSALKAKGLAFARGGKEGPPSRPGTGGKKTG